MSASRLWDKIVCPHHIAKKGRWIRVAPWPPGSTGCARLLLWKLSPHPASVGRAMGTAERWDRSGLRWVQTTLQDTGKQQTHLSGRHPRWEGWERSLDLQPSGLLFPEPREKHGHPGARGTATQVGGLAGHVCFSGAVLFMDVAFSWASPGAAPLLCWKEDLASHWGPFHQIL